MAKRDEIKELVIDELLSILRNYEYAKGEETDRRLIRAVLSIPELAVVDRGAKFPLPYVPVDDQGSPDLRFAHGAKKQRESMKGWIKEVSND